MATLSFDDGDLHARERARAEADPGAGEVVGGHATLATGDGVLPRLDRRVECAFHHLHVSEEVTERVDGMGAERAEGTATLVFVAPPGPGERAAAAAPGVDDVRRADRFSESSLPDPLPKQLPARVETELVVDPGDLRRALLRFLPHPERLAAAECGRFLAHHVAAGAERVHRLLVVTVGWRHDEDEIRRRARQDLAVVVRDLVDSELRRRLAGPLHVRARDPDEPHSVHVTETGEDRATGESVSEERDPDVVGHSGTPFPRVSQASSSPRRSGAGRPRILSARVPVRVNIGGG
ncbi:MAG: hypothetical protein R3E97_16310 [Candidatus Eisenbacteria bacterium]